MDPEGMPVLKEFCGYKITSRKPERRRAHSIYEALQGGLDRKVELRVLNRLIQAEDPAYRRFLKEVELLAALDHPALIKVLDVGQHEGRVYYVTEWRDCISLAEHLWNEGQLEPLKAFELLLPVGEALGILHREGFLHRDLSSLSIRYDAANSRAFLADFSLLKDLEGTNLTEKGFQGPASQAAFTPEEMHGDPFDARTDLFLFAAVLYQALTGKRRPTGQEVREKDIKYPFEFRSPGQTIPGFPEALEKVLMSALEVDPELRPSSMDAFLKQAEKALKQYEVKDVARAANRQALEKRAQELDSAREEQEEAEHIARLERARLRDASAQEALQASSKEVLSELAKQGKLWLEEDSKNPKKLGAGVLALGLGVFGLQQFMVPTAGPGDLTSLQVRKRSLRRTKLDPKELATKLLPILQAIDSTPTDPVNFDQRSRPYKRFLRVYTGKEKKQKVAEFTELSVLFYKDPPAASQKLDAMLRAIAPKAEELAKGPGAAEAK